MNSPCVRLPFCGWKNTSKILISLDDKYCSDTTKPRERWLFFNNQLWDFAVNQMETQDCACQCLTADTPGISKRINQPWFASFRGANPSTVANWGYLHDLPEHRVGKRYVQTSSFQVSPHITQAASSNPLLWGHFWLHQLTHGVKASYLTSLHLGFLIFKMLTINKVYRAILRVK